LDVYYVDTWDNSAAPSYFTLFEDETFALPSTSVYLFGERGIESGNVKTYAVSYASQSTFTTRDEYGYPII